MFSKHGEFTFKSRTLMKNQNFIKSNDCYFCYNSKKYKNLSFVIHLTKYITLFVYETFLLLFYFPPKTLSLSTWETKSSMLKSQIPWYHPSLSRTSWWNYISSALHYSFQGFQENSMGVYIMNNFASFSSIRNQTHQIVL